MEWVGRSTTLVFRTSTLGSCTPHDHANVSLYMLFLYVFHTPPSLLFCSPLRLLESLQIAAEARLLQEWATMGTSRFPE